MSRDLDESALEAAPAPEFDLDWPFALGKPTVRADFRTVEEDFRVDEELGFEPCGSGEHVYLHLRKRGDNTDWVARQIARLAQVQPMDVGYCGLKDRHAVTSQWFSVYLPRGAEPDWQLLAAEGQQLLAVSRHTHKLRRGQHAANRFEIRLRNLTGELDENRLTAALQRVPNYFGEQRFGHQGNNLQVADALLRGGRRIKNRQKRGLMISAARSYLFNAVLAERLRLGNWTESLAGDLPEPSGPLWGRGRSLSTAATLALEAQVLAPWRHWCDGLEHLGLKQERRVLALCPRDPSWRRQGQDLVLNFGLPPGTYATAVLREIAQLQQPSREEPH